MENIEQELNSLQPTLFFDGVCNLCNDSVAFILNHERDDSLRFASLQSNLAARVLPDDAADASNQKRGDPDPDSPGSAIYVRSGMIYRRSDAVIQASKHLRYPWRLLQFGVIVPRPARDALYELIARNRYRWFGRRDNCMVPTPSLRERFHD